MLAYCRELKFEEDPDYKLLYGLILKIFKDRGTRMNFKYDWIENDYEPSLQIIKEIMGSDYEEQ